MIAHVCRCILAIVWLVGFWTSVGCAEGVVPLIDLDRPDSRLDRWIAMRSTAPPSAAFPDHAGVESANITDADFRRSGRVVVAEKIDLDDACGGSGEGGADIYYAQTRAKTTIAGPRYLLVGCDDKIDVKVNGQLAFSLSNTWDGVHPKRLEKLTLEAGENLILVKVTNLKGGAGFALMLQPDLKTAMKESLRARETGILRRSIYGMNNQPESRIDSDIPEAATSLVTRAVGPAHVDGPGLYEASITLGSEIFRQTFLVGSPETEYLRLGARARETSLTDEISINFDALRRRMDLLLSAENQKHGDANWELKTVETLDQFAGIISDLESNAEPFRDRRGLVLKTFRSQIDGHPQTYRVFVPSSTPPKQGWPLVVFFPTVVSSSRPFIESPFMAAHIAAKNMARIAEKLGAALLWVGYRNQPYGHLCEIAHFDEVMTDLGRDHQIDPARVSLVGSCSGGIQVAMHAAYFPRRFASLGLHDALFSRKRNNFADAYEFFHWPANKAWLQATDPWRLLRRLGEACPPSLAFVEAAGDLDGVRARDAQEFVRDMTDVKASASYLGRQQAYGRKEEWEVIFGWCLQQRNPAPSPAPAAWLDSAHNSIGPIERAFTGKFIVVVGTQGDVQEDEACERIGREFALVWRANQYGECRIRTDSSLTATESADSNLILIGNPRSNSVWASLPSTNLPQLEPDRIVVGGRTIMASNPSAQAIARSPFNPDRRIVFMGASNVLQAKFSIMNLAMDGWYDYAVFSTGRFGVVRLVAAEHYSEQVLRQEPIP